MVNVSKIRSNHRMLFLCIVKCSRNLLYKFRGYLEKMEHLGNQDNLVQEVPQEHKAKEAEKEIKARKVVKEILDLMARQGIEASWDHQETKEHLGKEEDKETEEKAEIKVHVVLLA